MIIDKCGIIASTALDDNMPIKLRHIILTSNLAGGDSINSAWATPKYWHKKGA